MAQHININELSDKTTIFKNDFALELAKIINVISKCIEGYPVYLTRWSDVDGYSVLELPAEYLFPHEQGGIAYAIRGIDFHEDFEVASLEVHVVGDYFSYYIVI